MVSASEDCEWEWIVGGAKSIHSDGAVQIVTTSLDEIEDTFRSQASPFDVAVVRVHGRNDRPLLDRIADRSVLVVTIGLAPPGFSAVGEVVVDTDAPSLLADALANQLGDRRSYLLGFGEDDEAEAARLRFEHAMAARFELRRLDQATLPPDSSAALAALRELHRRFRYSGAVVTLSPIPWLDQGLLGESFLPDADADQPPVILTLGSCPGLWEHVRHGRVAAAVGPLAGDIGREAIRRSMEVVASTTTKAMRVIIPVEVIQADNLDDFELRYFKAAGRR